jgi:DNA-binding MarR family transcriptional regulator
MTDQRPIGFWLKLVDRMIDEQFASTLEEHGVTRRQWQLLNTLSRGPASVEQLDAAIAPFLSAEGSESAADHLTELIESAWVDATPSGYELTERGRVAHDRLDAVVTGQRELATEGVTGEAYLATVGTLERMARNLGWSG